MRDEKDYMLSGVNALKTAILKSRIDELVAVYGSMRALGKSLHIDHAYLHRLANGEKENPSKSISRKLGLMP